MNEKQTFSIWENGKHLTGKVVGKKNDELIVLWSDGTTTLETDPEQKVEIKELKKGEL